MIAFAGNRGRTASAIALAMLLLSATTAAAQDEQAVRATIDFGFVNAAGNTDVTTLNVGQELRFESGGWGVKQVFGVVHGRVDGEVSASSWRTLVRGDRTVRSRIGVYLLSAFDRNTFAGISRRFEEGVGVVVQAVDAPNDRLEVEAGGGMTQQRSTAGESRSFASGRAAATYRRTLTESSHTQLTTEFLPNLEETRDYRVNAAAELVAPISARLATKLAYAVRFENEPEPGFRKADRIFTAGLQFTF